MTSVQTTVQMTQLPASVSAPVTPVVLTADSDAVKRKRRVEDLSSSQLNVKRLRTDFSSQMYTRVIKSALEALEKGDTTHIDTLTAQVNLPASNSESFTTHSLSTILRLLSQEVSRLDRRSCSGLIQALVQYDWLAHSDDVELVHSYSRFMAVLVSGMPRMFSTVANKLVGGFSSANNNALPQLHNTLKYIIQISPSSFSALPEILRAHFPNKAATKSELVGYVQNLLVLLSYCDDLRYSVWSLIVEKLISLDVELQNEIDDVDDDELDLALNLDEEEERESDEEEVDDDEGDVNEEEEDDDDNNETRAESAMSIVTEATEEDITVGQKEEDAMLSKLNEELVDEEEVFAPVVQTIADLSEKLDAMMNLILEQWQSSFNPEALASGEAIKLFSTLMSVFRTYILPTHYTSCVQYLIFDAVQQQPDLMDSFLVMLIEIVFNMNETVATRIKAMQYTASFIARAKLLSRDKLLSVTKYLMDWCTEYISEREKEVGDGNGGMDRFKMLYCVMQGLMYIVCFRYEEFRSEDNEDEWALRLDKFFNMAIMSKFNPLKFCNESVVLIFARMSNKVDMCYCYTIIEKNKRERLNGVRNTLARNSDMMDAKFESKQEFQDLEAYFPFDPLILKNTRKIVDRNYIEWLDDSDSNDEES